jgi:predicted RNase H-like nuclease (RuvC/YqgF family)
MAPLRGQIEKARKVRERNVELKKENERLKAELERMQNAVDQFVERHEEGKIERKTENLQAIAKLRAERETHEVEFCAFVLGQLRPYVDGEYDLDDGSVRRIVQRVAAMLKS